MKERNKIFYDLVLIMAGVLLLAVSITVFFDANHMVIGGFTGISIIVRSFGELTGHAVPLWVTNTVLNVPLFAVGFKIFGARRLLKTLLATAGLSGALYAAKFIPPMENEPLLAAVFGGVISGVGLGLVFKSLATTGGTDMIAALINKYARHVAVSRIMFLIDTAVILAGFFVFGAVSAMYAIMAAFISAKTIDVVLEGLSFAKAAFIISDEHDKISQRIMSEMNRGVTGLLGTGMYTKAAKNVLLCVVSSKELVKIKDIVHETDKKAFLIVADVREVLGEGF
ncbi:MAG: YitT family protein [Clostridiales bacterium]|jgi:uncharacterized membrane-anchored protein YitT (DUF2179 family)|nr:YitT family protein [Clostridiales bacterium]